MSKTPEPSPPQAPGGAMRWRLTLPLAPSVNAYARVGRTRSGASVIYRPPLVKSWEEEARLALMAAGVRRLDPDTYWCWSITMRVHSCTGDVDNRLKLVIDVCESVLGIDDKWLRHVGAEKLWVSHRDQQQIELVLSVIPLRAQTVIEAKREMNGLELGDEFRALPAASGAPSRSA